MQLRVLILLKELLHLYHHKSKTYKVSYGFIHNKCKLFVLLPLSIKCILSPSCRKFSLSRLLRGACCNGVLTYIHFTGSLKIPIENIKSVKVYVFNLVSGERYREIV